MLIYQGVIHPCGDSEEVPLADHIQPSFPEGRVKVTRFTQMHTALYIKTKQSALNLIKSWGWIRISIMFPTKNGSQHISRWSFIKPKWIKIDGFKWLSLQYY